MKAFISHSSSEQEAAVALKSVLEELNIEPFLAHNDIRASQQWSERIISELKECNVFVALLSRAFKRSDWCAQESGAAILRRDDIVIIPISLDGTKPYGFLSHYQCHSALDGKVPSSMILDAVGTKWPSRVIDILIRGLDRAHSFRAAETLIAPLVPYFDQLTRAQATQIAKKAIENGQIWSAHLCRESYLPTFLRLNKRRLSTNLLKALQYQVNEQKWFKEQDL
jgi:hypothetical protein